MIKRKEIIEHIELHQEARHVVKMISGRKDRKLFSKVLSLYFNYMYQALLDGHRWNNRIVGVLTIEKRELKINKLRFVPKYYKGDVYIRNKMEMNSKVLNFEYFLNAQFSALKNNDCKFASAPWFRRKLSNQLRETGKIEPLWQ